VSSFAPVNPLRPAGVVLAALALTSCAATIHNRTVFRDPSYESTPVHRVFVGVMTRERYEQVRFEDALSQALAARGFEAVPACSKFPHGEMDEKGIAAYAKEVKADLVLVERVTALDLGQTDGPPAIASADVHVYTAGKYPNDPVWTGDWSAQKFRSVEDIATPVTEAMVSDLVQARILVR